MLAGWTMKMKHCPSERIVVMTLYVQAYYAKDNDETKVEDIGDAESKAEDNAENTEPGMRYVSFCTNREN